MIPKKLIFIPFQDRMHLGALSDKAQRQLRLVTQANPVIARK